jgi:DNA polymerase-3 subunit epsilon
MSVPPPPLGPPWDLPVAEAPLVFVDLEMTGLDVTRDAILEVCVERWAGGTKLGEVASLVRPPAGGTDRARHIHGIAPEMVEAAPTFAELAPRVRTLLDGAVFVAHAAEWDAKFLRKGFEATGTPVAIEHWIDTLNLSRRCFGLESHSLDALCKHFGIVRERAHRAGDDVAALREVFRRCVDALRPTTPRDLWEVRVAERRAREVVVAACEAAVLAKQPVKVTYRPSRRAAQVLPMILTEVHKESDPPRIVGYLLPSRSRRELRGDRILHVEPATS